MANEFARNIVDATFTVTRALTAADGSVTSSDIDLGSTVYAANELFEVNVAVPALESAELNTSDTLTIQLLAGASASPTTVRGEYVITGTGSAIAAQDVRFAVPSDAGRYLAVKFTTAGTTGDMSDKTATITLRF